jgi:Sugar phosphate isomerases/epimerases
MQFVKDSGGETIQLSAMPEMPARDIKNAADDAGLSICATHASYARIKDDFDRLAEEHLIYGSPTIGISMIPPQHYNWLSIDAIKKFAAFMNEAQNKAEKYGLFMHYHNHWYEFKERKWGNIYDTLLNEFDPKIKFSLDIYWAKVAGKDPSELIKILGDRLYLLHCKDLKKTLFGNKMLTPGEGTLDYKKYLSEASSAAAALVEVDRSKDPRKAVSDGIKFLKNCIT